MPADLELDIAPPAPDHWARLRTGLAGAAERDGLLDVAYTSHDSPIGPLIVAATPAGLVKIAFDSEEPDEVLERLAARLSPRLLEAPARVDFARRQLDEYFDRRRTVFDLPLDWSLTAGFRRVVLDATSRIPFGHTGTYTSVAAAAGSPRAVRAAGSALATNPLPVVVPCHRVLRSDGSLGGYGGGLDRKRLLLALERARNGDSGRPGDEFSPRRTS